MSSDSPVSLAARRLRRELARRQRSEGVPSRSSFLAARSEYDELGRAVGVPADIRVTTATAGHVPIEHLRPAGAEDRTVLYLHGGGYVMGSLDASRLDASQLARVARAHVVSVGYRLAPEHPFPAAVDDALTAYRHVLESVSAPQRLVVVGSSAGGGLAVATLVAAREAGLAQPAGLVTLSAWADLRCTSDSYRTRARRDPALTPAGLRLAASLYLAGASPHQPLASPVLADLHGLPPTLALVGTEEVLFDDTLRLVERLRAAGVHTRTRIGWGMVHCWTGYAGQVPEADEALAIVGDVVRERTPSA